MKHPMCVHPVEAAVVPARKEPDESKATIADTGNHDDVEHNPAMVLSAEFEEMKKIVSTLQKSIGFNPVDIHRCFDQSNSTTKSSDLPFLSLTMDYDDNSVDSRYPVEGEEDSDDDDNESVSDTKRYRTIAKSLDKAIRTTEHHGDDDDDEQPSSTRLEIPRRSLLPGRPETGMSSDLRDFLRQEAIVNTSVDKVDPQDLNKEVNPAILAYVNRRKAVEEHTILIENEHGRVRQRLADLKAKRIARFRAKKAAAGQGIRSK
jgi:hypothetical protein